MMDTNERKVLLSYSDRDVAESVRGYLVKELRIAGDLGIEIEEGVSSYGRYALTVNPYFYSFSESVQKCQDAAGDYVSGLKQGHEKAERKILRSWRGTLRTRTCDGVKPIEWADPVGLEAGLTCRRVGRGLDDGMLYIRVWDEETGKASWQECWSEDVLERCLAEEGYLPWPHWLGED